MGIVGHQLSSIKNNSQKHIVDNCWPLMTGQKLSTIINNAEE